MVHKHLRIPINVHVVSPLTIVRRMREDVLREAGMYGGYVLVQVIMFQKRPK